MISNVIDLSSGIGGTKDSLTGTKIANSQQEEPGTQASYSACSASSIAERIPEQEAAIVSDLPPVGTLNLLISPAQTQVSTTQSGQTSPGQFMISGEYQASLNPSGVETLNRFLHLSNDQNQTAPPFVTSPPLQGGTYSASDASKTSAHNTAQVSQLQTLTGKANETPLSLNQTQTSSLPLPEQPGGKHPFSSQFSASLSGERNANLHLPLTLAESRLSDVNEAAVQVLAGGHRTQAPVSQWGPVPVTSAAPLAHQAQEMLSPLREQIRFQVDQQIKQAELRLDPPELGKVELSIRLDGDRLHIQMHAANASVRDSLLIGLERLRAELAMDHGGQIDVDINQGKQEQRESSPEASSISLARGDEPDNHSTKHDSQQSNQIDLLA
ncbi:hypothetical protein Ssed_0053 [Shewanella sediminis HAW-EB3]|uniref:Flagellar hook-length control protein-like C-terminal domain-containing protein n=1 Tax=Shewanella sediminis (strain HAW-EB3) TaxID=425104 RepID=A8FP93_SHESH|nr:flagellar hook-length control protein FliK [Shewanella sediminis]ABV34666.1 hypothetical protein Ssed_0053 [Shewanella sediminis HAW-EB3]